MSPSIQRVGGTRCSLDVCELIFLYVQSVSRPLRWSDMKQFRGTLYRATDIADIWLREYRGDDDPPLKYLCSLQSVSIY